MRYGVNMPAFGDLAEPRALAGLARDAEEAGWDGFFIWDHMIFDPTFHPMADPWVALAAAAMTTRRIRLGTMVTPLPRRRPWKLARETVSVDRLSQGRLILGVGLGDPVRWEFGWFGEEEDARVRARKLDEGLAILAGLWSGRPFRYRGEQFRLDEMTFRPTPVQSPRIPIWVAGAWPNRRPFRRAARWDGVYPLSWERPLTPDDFTAMLAYIGEHRATAAPFDVVQAGETPGDRPDEAVRIVEPFVDVGVTWWIENVTPWRYGWSYEAPWAPEATERIRERVLQGPPRP